MTSKAPPQPTSPRRDDLVSSFDALALSGNPPQPSPRTKPVPNKEGGFVGGFSPNMNVATMNGWVPSAFLRQDSNNQPAPAVPMPVPRRSNSGQPPQSLTMQHALNTPPRPGPSGLMPPWPHTPPSRPQSEGVLSPPSYPPSSSSPLDIKTTPTTAPKRPRASSVPPNSPSTPSKGSTVQCSGNTKEGKRCTRQVKVGTSAYASTHPDAEIEKYCHQHAKVLLDNKGFFSHRATDEWIKFEDWIPEYLQPDTQVALRVEMEKPRSRADVSGYIYTFEIRDPKTPNKIHLKVGRAVNLVKRMDQWDKQCGSKEQVLRGWWPGTVEDDDGGPTSLMKGRVKAGDKGPLCHRLERLVHLELADLAVNSPYLDPDFQTIAAKKKDKGKDKDVGGGTPSKKAIQAIKLISTPCTDCGTIHKEIFSMDRVERGPYKGKEWESIVKPVIEKWGAFVSAYV